VLTKGADVVMEHLLARPIPPAARTANHEFSFAGLRTLFLAQRLISPSEYTTFQAEWTRATCALDRTVELATLTNSVEHALDYVGITAVEDRLQQDVPATIAALRAAGMRFWVLTGDKVETAVSIAYSSNVFEHGMKVTNVANPSTRASLIEDLQAAVAERHMALSHGLVLDGQCVDILEDCSARKALMDLSMDITSCVACRLSPSQKSSLLRLVCAHSGSIAVAIGDGANDVPMLQAAHIGVGIRGIEGSAAVLASDVAVCEFRFLKILLLCHGRKFYRRVALFLLWYNYKQLMKAWSNIIYGHGVTVQRNCFPDNVEDLTEIFQEVAVVLAIAFDKDVPNHVASSPLLYSPGPRRKLFNLRVYAQWMAFASFHGIVAWVVPMCCLDSAEPAEFWAASTVSYTSLVAIGYLRFIIANWLHVHRVTFVIVLTAVAGYLLMLHLLAFTGMSPQLAGLGAAASWQHVMCLLCVPVVAVTPDLVMVRRRPWSLSRLRHMHFV